MPLLAELLASGGLRSPDVIVLLQLLLRVNSRSGKARASVRTLAAEVGGSSSAVAHSVRRLRLAGLVVKGEGGHQRPATYYVSPLIGQTGSWEEKSKSAQMFAFALRNSPPPAPVTEGAVRARHALPQHLQQQAG